MLIIIILNIQMKRNHSTRSQSGATDDDNPAKTPWIAHKMYRQEREKVRLYVNDASNYLDLDRNDSDFVDNLVDKVLAHMQFHDDRWDQVIDHEDPTELRKFR